ncbi:MAG: alpha-amylase family glycosyl hydrolase, partial [Lysobacterales bacterium]
MRKSCLPFAIALALAASGCGRQPILEGPSTEPGTDVQHDGTAAVFVHLFEWRWVDIATECENVLGPAGYQAVQVSPPNEHVVGPQWWTRYQPVSYRIESRGGTRAEFADMVERCKAAGVDVYADAVTNHMAGIFTGTGFAGSAYAENEYPVPYRQDDFHRCGRYEDDRIRNYQDLWEVQNCKLGTLQDLDTGKPAVQQKIAAYLKDLLSLGVAGFRLDAAKHMPVEDITAVLSLMDKDTFIYQEVIDRGGEPINGADYLVNGSVTDFRYQLRVSEAFQQQGLGLLEGIGIDSDFLPADKAIVFVDNHDLQRGHAGDEGTLSHKQGALYELANVFMLAWPYGYPMVMSSYVFEDS